MQQVDFIQAVQLFFRRYTDFNGRSTRAEYWWVALFMLIVSIVLAFFGNIGQYTSYLFSLVCLVPGIALAVRRLHDVGRSGWWYLIALTGIGCLVLLYWFVQPSGPANEYGPNPYETPSAEA